MGRPNQPPCATRSAPLQLTVGRRRTPNTLQVFPFPPNLPSRHLYDTTFWLCCCSALLRFLHTKPFAIEVPETGSGRWIAKSSSEMHQAEGLVLIRSGEVISLIKDHRQTQIVPRALQRPNNRLLPRVGGPQLFCRRPWPLPNHVS